MTRHECEEMILEKLEEITDIYLKYNPDGKFLSMSYGVSEEGISYVSVNNCYWHGGEDEERVITVSKEFGMGASI